MGPLDSASSGRLTNPHHAHLSNHLKCDIVVHFQRLLPVKFHTHTHTHTYKNPYGSRLESGLIAIQSIRYS